MYVIVVGSPLEGFDVVGPLGKSDDADAVGEWARVKYGRSDYYQCKLKAPPEIEVRIDKAGTFVVFDGDIEGSFEFFGPFINDSAVDYATKFLGGRVLLLKPVDHVDIETAA